MVKILILAVADEGNLDDYMSHLGWKHIPFHWSMDCDKSIEYRAYSRNRDNQEEIAVFTEGGYRGYGLRHYFPIEGLRDVEAYNQYVQQLSDELTAQGITCEIITTECPNLSSVSVFSIKKLENYCSHANKKDGISSTFDKERWNEFVKASKHFHDECAILQQLFHVLIEQYKFSDNCSRRLVAAYEKATKC